MIEDRAKDVDGFVGFCFEESEFFGFFGDARSSGEASVSGIDRTFFEECKESGNHLSGINDGACEGFRWGWRDGSGWESRCGGGYGGGYGNREFGWGEGRFLAIFFLGEERGSGEEEQSEERGDWEIHARR